MFASICGFNRRILKKKCHFFLKCGIIYSISNAQRLNQALGVAKIFHKSMPRLFDVFDLCLDTRCFHYRFPAVFRRAAAIETIQSLRVRHLEQPSLAQLRKPSGMLPDIDSLL